MAGLGDWMELGESGEMVAAREEEPSPSGGWLRYFRGWVEATGRGPGLWEMVRSWTSTCLGNARVTSTWEG